jgi:hypothetical protein
VNWFAFAEGDTVPDGAYVLFDQTGAPGLRYETRIQDARGYNDQGGDRFYRTQWSPAEQSDTLGFHVGPLDYLVGFRTVDAADEPSETVTELSFVAGFPPSITSLQPQEGQALVMRFHPEGDWPENEVPYTVNPDDLPPGMKRYWDGSKYVFAEYPPSGSAFQVTGKIYRYRLRFEGEADPREPDTALKSWTYRIFGEYDPTNRIKEGAGSDVFGRYDTPGTPNVWDMSEYDDGVEIFIPDTIWFLSQLFAPGQPFYSMGVQLAKQLGEIQLQVQARTTGPGDELSYCEWTVRESCGAAALQFDTEELGRRTQVATSNFTAYLGLDPSNSGGITEYWPPTDYIVVPVLVSGLRAQVVDRAVELNWEWGADAPGERFRLDRIAADGRVEALEVEAPPAGGGLARMRDLPGGELSGQTLRYVLVQESQEGELELAETQLLFEIPRSGQLELHANVPNPFNPSTQLSFELPQAGEVRLSIHDVQGRRVRERTWDGRADDGSLVASGVYFARLEASNKVASIRMMLVK